MSPPAAPLLHTPLTPPAPARVTQSAPHHIVSIQALGQRVYISDVQESVFYVRYKRQENQLILFADDTSQRWVTATCLLDYDTVAAADKFGNVSVVSGGQQGEGGLPAALCAHTSDVQVL